MVKRLLYLLSLLLLSSCAQLRTEKLSDKKIEELIRSIRATGEGRGRLGIEKHQYLFSYDALLKENFDWLLAANIPLHGEEILLLQDLKKETVSQNATESLELRIEQGIRNYLIEKKKPAHLAGVFIRELRAMMRFILHEPLGLRVDCEAKGSQTTCVQNNNIYTVTSTNQQLSLKKSISSEFEIEFIAQNLTGSFFNRGSIFLHSLKTSSKPETLLSLELFWK